MRIENVVRVAIVFITSSWMLFSCSLVIAPFSQERHGLYLTGDLSGVAFERCAALNSVWQGDGAESVSDQDIDFLNDFLLVRGAKDEVTLAFICWNDASKSFHVENDYYYALKVGECHMFCRKMDDKSMLIYRFKLLNNELKLFTPRLDKFKGIAQAQVNGKAVNVDIDNLKKAFSEKAKMKDFFQAQAAAKFTRFPGDLKREQARLMKNFDLPQEFDLPHELLDEDD